MKKLLFLSILVFPFSFFFFHANAQAPSGFSFQSVLRDANSDLIINTSVGMQISLLQGTSTGTAVYVERHTASTNANGLVSLQVGSGSVQSGTFSSIDWADGPYFIKAETDPAGGTSYTISGTTQLMSVPYALFAANSGGSIPNGTDAGNTLHWNGTAWVADNALFNDGTNIGIGTTAPHAKLNVVDADSIPLKAEYNGETVGLPAIYGYNNTNGGNRSIGVLGSYNGTSTYGVGVQGFGYNGIDLPNESIDIGVYGTAYDYGVLGNSQYGSGIHGKSESGHGVHAEVTEADGVAGWFNGGPGTGLVVEAGNVGIGTTAPQATLDVQGTVLIADGTQGAGKVLTSDASGNATWEAAVSVPTGTTGQTMRHNGTDWVATSSLHNDGTNIGIGTTSPSYDLDIIKNDTLVDQRIYSNNPNGKGQLLTGANGGGEISVVANSSNTPYLGVPVGITGLTSTYTDMVFATGTGGTATEKMRLGTSGYLGLGTTSPTAAIDIKNNIAGIRIEDIDDNSIVGLSAPGNGATGGVGTSSNHDFPIYTNNNDRVTIKADGKVGIGTTTPDQLLDVNGQIQMRTGATAGYIPVSDATGTMTWTDPASISVGSASDTMSVIASSNRATRIETEQANDSTIHFTLGGIEYYKMIRDRIETASGRMIAIGHHAGLNNQQNRLCLFIGEEAGEYNTTGGYNVAVGGNALNANETSDFNVAVGEDALAYTTAAANTGIGTGVMWGNYTGVENTGMGNFAGAYMNGSYNVAIGSYAGRGTINHAQRANNTIVGAYAGRTGDGSGNVFLGYRAGYSEAASNRLYIDNSDTIAPLIYGEFTNNIIGINGKLGIGTQTPLNKLDVKGGMAVGAIYAGSSAAPANGAIIEGNVGIGTPTPTAKLDIVGAIKIKDGTEGAGKMLQSDANGLAHWANIGGINLLPSPPDPCPGMRVVGTYSHPDFLPQAVAVSGNYAYLIYHTTSVNESRLEVVNITDPEHPVLAGFVNVADVPNAIAVSGNYAYITNATNNTMRVIDISNPASPVLKGSVATGTSPQAIAASGNYAYVVNYDANIGMQIINIADPAQPVVSTTVPRAVGFSIALSGNYVYVPSDSLLVIDISNPPLPVIQNLTALGGGGGRTITVSGNYAYIDLLYTNVMQIVNITNPVLPVLNGTLSLGANGPLIGVSGNSAYVTGPGSGNTLGVIDITDPSAPAFTGSVGVGSTSLSLVVSGNFGYVAGEGVNGFQIIDLSCHDDYTFSLDGATGQTTAIPLQWTVNGNDISNANTGKVGINTPYPVNQLSVNGDANFTGKVGIGTSTPGNKLSVIGNTDFNGDMTVSGSTGIGGHANISGNANIAYRVSIGDANYSHDLTIEKTTTLVSERLYSNNSFGVGWLLTGANGGGEINLVANSGSSDFLGIAPSNSGIATNYGDMSFATGTSNSASEKMRITTDGNVGFGTTNPTQAKVVVNGYWGYDIGDYQYFSRTSTGANPVSGGSPHQYSIYASHRIAATEFNAFSDARIKHVIGRSDNAGDLNTLMQLQITDYNFIDTIGKGNGQYKKVIAQEVEKVYPQAVSQLTDVVPDIYKLAEINDCRITLANTLKPGDRVRLITEKKTDIFEVTAADADGFNVNLEGDGKVFVFGREVNDFRAVDYEALATLNISATQELMKMITALQSKNEGMEKKFASLQSDVELLKGMLNVSTTAEK